MNAEDFREEKESKSKRTRFPVVRPNVGAPAIKDELAFTQNKSSKNARREFGTQEAYEADIWIGKHYQIRNQHGDDLGKSEGIEQDKVHSIVKESVKYLMFYGATVKGFQFLNYNNQHDNGRLIRIVCQQEIDGNQLNVIIECHVIKLDFYEITIITALQKNDFILSDGQYSVLLLGKGSSILLHSSRGKINEISSI